MTWLMFLAMHELNMTLTEAKLTRYGELLDLLSCLAVYNGTAKVRKRLTYDEAMELI